MKVRVPRGGPAERLPFEEMIAVLRSWPARSKRWSTMRICVAGPGVVDRMEHVGDRDTPMGCNEHRVQGARLLREMHGGRARAAAQ